MFKKIMLIALAAFSLCNAAMIGDFSPMKVGNKWVYSDSEITFYYGTGYGSSHDRTIKIISMKQNGDSLFFTILDSTFSKGSGSGTRAIKNYLELNNNNFLYDSSSKQYGEPEDFFKFHQLPDSMLKKVTFANQSLYCYSANYISIGCSTQLGSCWMNDWQWVQNYGLYSSYSGFRSGGNGNGSYSYLNLVSFNDQPVDSSITTIAYKNRVPISSATPLIYADSRHQIHWRGLSATDHLSVQVYDYQGKLLISSRQLPGSFVFNTSQLLSGAYILKYKVNSGNWRYFSFARNI